MEKYSAHEIFGSETTVISIDKQITFVRKFTSSFTLLLRSLQLLKYMAVSKIEEM